VNDNTAVAMFGELIPIIAIVFGIGCFMLRIYFDFRKKREMFQLYHAERMAAIEKGIELPPLPDEFFQDRRLEAAPVRNRRNGLILTFLGVAITLALWGTGISQYWWGGVVLALGLAFLLASFLEFREQAKLPPRASQPPARI